jgi:hypothetical protein
MDQRPSLVSRVTVRACWGARLREGVAARTAACANAHATRTRRERDANAPAWRGGDQNGAASYC